MAWEHKLFCKVGFKELGSINDFVTIWNAAQTFAANNDGVLTLDYLNHNIITDEWSTGIRFWIPVTGWTQGSARMNSLITALEGFPAHHGLQFKMQSDEVSDPPE